MHISWLGMSSFKIQTKENVIITDPYDDNIGIKMPKLKADIVVLSDPQNKETNNVQRLSGEPFVIDSAGEYELKETFVYGHKAGEGDQAENIIYSIECEGISVGFLGLINHSLTDKQLEIMEGVDVLLLPISTLTSERRTKLISQIDPRVVIPMQYKIPKVKTKLEPIEQFAKEVGVKTINYEEKIILKKKELPQEETSTIFLKPSF